MKEIFILPLVEEFNEYKEIIKDIPADETITIEQYPLMIKDSQKKVIEKLNSNSSVEEIQKAIEKSKYIQVSKRLMELYSRGFGSGIISLFERFDSEENDIAKFNEEINLVTMIPKEIRKNSQLSYDNSGYYHAGFYNKFE